MTLSNGFCRKSKNSRATTNSCSATGWWKSTLDLLEHLIEAYYQKEKTASLRAANLEIEKLRHLLQISTEMRIASAGPTGIRDAVAEPDWIYGRPVDAAAGKPGHDRGVEQPTLWERLTSFREPVRRG